MFESQISHAISANIRDPRLLTQSGDAPALGIRVKNSLRGLFNNF
jgi:hypothetical protein